MFAAPKPGSNDEDNLIEILHTVQEEEHFASFSDQKIRFEITHIRGGGAQAVITRKSSQKYPQK